MIHVARKFIVTLVLGNGGYILKWLVDMYAECGDIVSF